MAPTGIASGIERLDRFEVEVDALPTQDVPDWMRGAVVYQIFPDRFANGDPTNDPAGTVPWGSPPEGTTVMGGDLAGIGSRVDHLVDLGVDVVYTTPIFSSPSNHKYDTTDYHAVDPAFGGDEALRDLVATLHANGIRVVLDVSLNHTHPSFFAFRDLCEKGESSPYRDWFVVDDWPPRVVSRPALIRPGDFGRGTWRCVTGSPSCWSRRSMTTARRYRRRTSRGTGSPPCPGSTSGAQRRDAT